jgi:hypothetical protein
MKKWLVIGVVTIGVVAAAVVLWRWPKADPWMDTLREVLIGADRLVVHSSKGYPLDHTDLWIDLSEREEVANFIDLIELKHKPDREPCKCDGNCIIVFCKGDKELATLCYFHDDMPRALRWFNGKWPMDAFLSRESGQAIADWLVSHGVTNLTPGDW